MNNGNYDSALGAGLAGIGIIAMLLYIAWIIITYVQMFLGFGTAYRKTKANGDNGVSLFGWMFVYNLAALIPGLGFYLWYKSKEPKVQPPEQQNLQQ